MTAEVVRSEHRGARANARKDQASGSIWRLVRSSDVIVPMAQGIGRPAAMPFYCVHPVAGDVTSFRPLAEALGDDQAFYGLQVPCGQLNSRFASSIEAMANHYVHVISIRQPDGPLVIGGWSAGAVVALEMAQQFRRLGRIIPALIAFDGAPCNTGCVPPSALSRWTRALCNVPAWTHDLFTRARKQDGVLRSLVQTFRFYKTLHHHIEADNTVDAFAVAEVLDKTRGQEDQRAFIVAFFSAVSVYAAAPYEGKVIVFEMVTQPLLQNRVIAEAWRKIASDVEVIRLKGSHGAIFTPPALASISKCLKVALALPDPQDKPT